MSTQPPVLDVNDPGFIAANLSQEARLEASGLTNPRFWRLAQLAVLGVRVSQHQIRELNGPSEHMSGLLDAMSSKNTDMTPLAEHEVVKHIALLGPIEAMQLASLSELHVSRSRKPTAQEEITEQNIYLIRRIVREMQKNDGGWGSLDRVTGHGPHAERTRRGLATGPANALAADGKIVDPQLP